MIHIDVPGATALTLTHLVLDVNGTLTVRGEPIAGVWERLQRLRPQLEPHLVTADTYGSAEPLALQLGAACQRIAHGSEKRRYVETLDPRTVVAIGNGANDAAMLATAALGVVVLGDEGAAPAALAAAAVVAPSIAAALDLLLFPRALVATLRP